jgi:hypothetical protein
MTRERIKEWLLVVAVLLLFGLMSVAPAAALRLAQTEIIPGTEEQLPGASGQYIDISGRVDAAGNSFVAIATHDPGNNNITWVELRRYNTAGAITWYEEARPKPQRKIDSISIYNSGSSLVVDGITHSYGSPTRVRQAERLGIYPNVFTYTPGFENQEGGEGAFQPVAATCEIDYGRIERAIAAEGVLTRGALRSALRAELVSMGVITEQMFNGGAGSYIVYQQLRATSYSGAVDAIGNCTP